MHKWIGLTSLALVIAGCGGGGGGGSTTADTPSSPTPPVAEQTSPLSVFGETQVAAGESVEFAIATDSGAALSDIHWQVNNEAIKVLSGHTQVIGFDAPEPGDYPITVTATSSTGEQLEQSFTLMVTAESAPRVNVRVGREATELGRVSLRAFVTPPDNTEITDISWQQETGPDVVNLTFDQTGLRNNIYFQAPEVERDQLLRFRATATFSDGTTSSDASLVMVNNEPYSENALSVYDNNSDGIPETLSARMLPANADSPYADDLQNCVYSNIQTNSCPFSRLPLLGQETESPGIEDVMDRTLVSHPWMADAFRAYLQNSLAGEDMLNLLRASTAVVISYDVRPSYYTAATATIYLDARYFWRTPQERDTLDTAPDFRSGFGNALNYTTFWRYVKDGAYYYPRPGTPVDARTNRSIEDVTAGVVRLMYHELAHANDYFDYTIWSQLSDSDTPISVFNERRGNINSNALDERSPLTSDALLALADVRYLGETPTEEQQTYTAQMVADWFEEDTAVDHYAYTTIREDFAMLFERFMMLHRIGASADEGTFTSETVEAQDYVLTYGHRDRVSNPTVRPRAAFVVERILPELDIDAALAGLPDEQQLPAGETWQATVDLGGDADNPASAAMTAPDQQALLKEMMDTRDFHHAINAR